MRRRSFLKLLAAGAAAKGAFGMSEENATGRRNVFLLSRDGCSRATGYAETNKIVSIGDRTHVAWLDSVKEGFRVRIRTLDKKDGTWSPVYTVGEAYDNHGGPALSCDSEGHLHIVFYPHHHPFRYRKSTRPNDASQWEEEIRFGEKCTYPTLLVGADDSLYLTCQESHVDPWVVGLYIKRPGQDWVREDSILRAKDKGYSHFQEAMVWGMDRRTIHLSTRMYGGKPGRAHTVGYMKSMDLGETWQRADGTPLELPATQDTIDLIETDDGKGGRSFRCGSIALGPTDTPYVLYSDASQRPSAVFVAKPGEGAWEKMSLIRSIEQAASGCWAAMPGGLCFAEDGTAHVCLTAETVRDGAEGKAGGWGEERQEILWLASRDLFKTVSGGLVSPVDPACPHWLPNMERPTGHHPVSLPGILYTAGTRGGKNTDVVSNEVYWVGS